MYRIGEFSKITKTTIKTLRYYDEVDLLKPAYIDPENKYRYYTTEQLMPLQCILALRQIGLSINEVKRILSGNDAREILRNRQAELVSELDYVKEQLSRVQIILQSSEEEYFMRYQAIIKELPECIVYYKQGVVPNFSGLVEFILQSGEECMQANPDMKCVEPDYCYVTYLDPEFREKDMHVEYAQAVIKMGKETEQIRFKKLLPVPAICVYHKGPYDTLGEAYAFAYQWGKENGYRPIQGAREHYIDGMWNKENPEEWLTEIQIPIEQKK